MPRQTRILHRSKSTGSRSKVVHKVRETNESIQVPLLCSVSSHFPSKRLTLKQKYEMMLSDLIEERKDEHNSYVWNETLDKKIEELRKAIKEKVWLKD